MFQRRGGRQQRPAAMRWHSEPKHASLQKIMGTNKAGTAKRWGQGLPAANAKQSIAVLCWAYDIVSSSLSQQQHLHCRCSRLP